MSKFGTKNLRRYGLGVKHQVNSFSKFGAKASHIAAAASPIIDLFAPEVGVPLAAAAETVGAVSSGLERATR